MEKPSLVPLLTCGAWNNVEKYCTVLDVLNDRYPLEAIMQIFREYETRRRIRPFYVIRTFAKSPGFLWAWIIYIAISGHTLGFPMICLTILIIAMIADFLASICLGWRYRRVSNHPA